VGRVDKPITRRDFLKLTGKVGALIGLGAGLGSVVGSCEEPPDVTNTLATIVGAETTAETSSSVERGREIRVGVVSARTGSLALFGKADDWWIEYAGIACPEGVICEDRRLHRFLFAVEDSGSDPDAAAAAAESLIAEAAVDMITCSGSASLVNAVADRAETLGCPCLSSFHQWRPFVFRGDEQPEAPYKWTYAHAVGLEDIAANYVAMWEQVATNRKVGLVITDDDESSLWVDSSTGLPSMLEGFGYEIVLPALSLPGTDDFTGHISEFSKSGCEICCAVMSAEDLLTLWRQSLQLEYEPKVVTAGRALRFPHVLEAMGTRARNFTAESLWQPDWPYVDSLTGSSAEELAEDYMTRTGQQWIAPLAQYAKFEWMADVFKRVIDLDSKEEVARQVGMTKLDTCLGPIDFTSPVGTAEAGTGTRPSENVCKAPVAGAQWVGGGVPKLRPATVANSGWSEVPVANTVQLMTYE